MKLIEVTHLSKTYYSHHIETHALRDVSFSVEAGEFIAIIGPSGSGKSTLLHVLGFLDQPTDGQYLFNGKSLIEYSEDERAVVRNEKMGFVFQAFNLLSRTSVFDNVRLPLLYSNVPEADWNTRVCDAIESVGLSQRSAHESSELSGGEKQRVAIARALVTHPQVIFADEPTGNLDTRSGESVMDIFHRLHCEQNHTIVLITHEMAIAGQAERILSIRDGKLEKDTKATSRG